MIEKVKILEERYSEISEKLSEPDTVNNQELYRDYEGNGGGWIAALPG